MFSSINKTFGCCSKIFGWSNKKLICCPEFWYRNKTIFFPVKLWKTVEAGRLRSQGRPPWPACSNTLTDSGTEHWALSHSWSISASLSSIPLYPHPLYFAPSSPHANPRKERDRRKRVCPSPGPIFGFSFSLSLPYAKFTRVILRCRTHKSFW